MKNKFLLGLFMIAILSLCFTYASSSNGWVEWHKVSESEWLKNTCPNLKNFSCDYTWDPVVLRVWYGVEFTDSIYAWGQDRWLKSQCSEIFEPDENWNYNKWDNPWFEFTENIRTAWGLVVKNNKPATLIIKSKADYQIRNHPVKRSSNNLMVKYAVEYVNDKKDNKQRYQHTECYPYIISRCGDGVVDKDWDWRCDKNGNNCKNPEQCDPASKDWIDRADGKTCSSTCTIVEPQDPVCSSSYNWKTEHTTSSEQWLKSTDKLCDEWSVDGFNFTPKTWWPRTYTWNCKNGSKITKSSCTAKQQWCGDWEKNGDEDCDDGDKNGTSASSCSKTCTTVGSATCWKKDGTTTYFTGGKQTEPWLTEKSDGLCPAGLTVGKPKMVGDYIEWTCSNKNGSERTCKAYQEWCGDWEKNGSEDCDWTDLCDFQCKKITPPKDCVNVFKWKLRLWQEHTFSDKFKAGWKDYYLYYWPDDVKFVENHGDYGTNPKFEWTSELTKKWNKVDANTEMVVMKSNPYKAVYKPTVRAWDNIYLEYTIWYSDVYKKTSPSKSNLYSNKECAYYEISWCGDGTLDTEYWEECDPGSAWTTSLSGGRICNSECKIESPKWTAVIEKTLKDKIEVTHTWQELIWEVKVTASWWNVTNFEIWDKMPVELEPNGTSWRNLDKTKSQNGIDVKYSNRKPNPKSSWNVNIHYWDVTWTLNQWKSITMLVKTKVKKMPWSWKNIVNIACVIKDNKEIDCDDDQPPKTEWYLVPDKTLIGTKEVKNTWDIIEWSLKVYAKWWDVKNPVIKDVLPTILWYSGYSVTRSAWLSIKQPTKGNILSGNVGLEVVRWKTEWTLKENDYIEIKITTYAKAMPKKQEKNVLCVYPEDKPEDEKCDPEPIGPKLWIKKYIMDWTNKVKEKTVNIWDEIVYRIEFWNKWEMPAIITSIKDFLPKNVGYRSSEVYVGWKKANIEVTKDTQSGELTLTNKYKVVDWVHIDIFGWLTLNPNTEWYIIIKWEILTWNQNNRTNFACIYLNDKKPDDDIVDGERCDSVVHNFDMCEKLDIPAGNLWSNGWPKTVTCTTMSGNADINIDCWDGATPRYITWSNTNKLQGTCNYPSGAKTYNLVCTVKKDDKTYNSNPSCKGTVTVEKGTTPGGWVKCKSNIDKEKNTDLCNGNSWTVPVNCESDGGTANKIEILCDNVVQSSWTNISSLSWSCTFSSDWNHNVKCKVNDSTWSVNNCEWTYNLKHHSCWPSCFVAWTKVTMADWTKKNIEDVEIWDMVLSYNTDTNTNESSVVEQRIIHEDSEHEMYELTINWNVLKATAVHPFYVRKSWFINMYNRTFGAKNFVLSIDYDWVEAQDLKVWDKLLMIDGSLVEIEWIKHYPNKETVYNLEVEGNHNYYVAEWYLVHNKPGPTPGPTPTPTPGPTPDPIVYPIGECFDINANELSYEQWEILPFYWNISNLWSGNIRYMTWSFYGTVKEIENNNKTYKSCSNDENWLIALNSMICHYQITDWNGKMVKQSDFPCLRDKNYSIDALFQNWMKKGRFFAGCEESNYMCFWTFNVKDRSYALRSNLNYIPNFWTTYEDWKTVDTFWEYKIKLSNISYLQCQNGEWESVSHHDVCESPFTLTNPYTVQKTPSGNLKASTETLRKYLYYLKDDSKKYNAAELLNAISASEYQPNEAVDNAMTKFINKYSKLAVNAWDWLKKVPGKNIYFVSKSIPCLWSSDCPKTIDLSKPTTIVQTQGDTTIKWNLDSNLMLLTNWQIKFDGSNSCTKRQVVKWIFYSALKPVGIKRVNVQKNTSLSNSTRCTEGWLMVKWVLIWRWLDWVMNNSRSNLNWWFKTTDKKSVVMNWASVIIEYSPSVFTKGTMPPGAEDFTTALSIYKD